MLGEESGERDVGVLNILGTSECRIGDELGGLGDNMTLWVSFINRIIT